MSTTSGGKLAPLVAAGASLGLFAAPWFIPLAGALLAVWTPLPVLVLYRRQGQKAGRLALVLALAGALLLGLGLTSLVAGGFYLFYAAVALFLAEAPLRGLDEPRGVGLGALAGVLVVLGIMVTIGLASGQDPLNLWRLSWQQEMDSLIKAYAQTGPEAGRLDDLRRGLEQTGFLVLKLAPGILTAGALLLAWGNLLVCRTFMGRLYPASSAQVPLNRWRAPEPLVWLVIVAGVLAWAGQNWWYWGAVDALIALGTVYFFQGMAIIAFWLEKKKAPRLLRVVVYALVAVEIFLALLVTLAGLFDLWFNFRRLEIKQPV